MYGFERLDFEFDGMHAVLVKPEQADSQRNWLFKTEYFDVFPN